MSTSGSATETALPNALACDLLRSLAARTWSDIRDGEAAGIRIGEESITDHLLLDLVRLFPYPTRVMKWSKWDEARKTGADWDWWFLDPVRDVGVGLRIQAKRIDYGRERMSGLEHENTHGPQRLMLQRSAQRAGLHPLYCLYLASSMQRTGPTGCGSFQSGEAPPGWLSSPLEIYGCSLVGPGVVDYAIATRDASLDFLWPFLLPWSCLVCCQATRGEMVEKVDQQGMRIEGMWPEDSVIVTSPEPLRRSMAELPPEVFLVVAGEGSFEDLTAPPVGATAVTLVSSDE